MKSSELKDAIKSKYAQLDQVIESGKPKDEQMKAYKELKELQFQLIQEELHSQGQEELLWHPVAGKASESNSLK